MICQITKQVFERGQDRPMRMSQRCAGKCHHRHHTCIFPVLVLSSYDSQLHLDGEELRTVVQKSWLKQKCWDHLKLFCY